MKQEKWIDEILESTKGMHKAEPSPFLFEQVIAKVRSGNFKKEHSVHENSTLRWFLAGFVSLIIMCNVLSLVKTNFVKEKNSDEKTASAEKYFNNATTYTY
jgi:hypothetical protein